MLIIEDGSIVEDANSYVTLDEADRFCIARGLWEETPVIVNEDDDNKTPDADTEARKSNAIIRACDALSTLEWKGVAVDISRTLSWPRNDVRLTKTSKQILSDIIPAAVKQAQMELAALIYNGTANPMEPLATTGKIKAYSESNSEGNIDVIGGDSKSYSITFAGNGGTVEKYLPSVYGILKPFLVRVPGQDMGFVVGAAVKG